MEVTHLVQRKQIKALAIHTTKLKVQQNEAIYTICLE